MTLVWDICATVSGQSRKNSLVEQHTFARVMNSCNTGVAPCSNVSSTSVRGLALSLRLSNFCSSNRLWDRLWAWAEGAMAGFSQVNRTPRFKFPRPVE